MWYSLRTGWHGSCRRVTHCRVRHTVWLRNERAVDQPVVLMHGVTNGYAGFARTALAFLQPPRTAVMASPERKGLPESLQQKLRITPSSPRQPGAAPPAPALAPPAAPPAPEGPTLMEQMMQAAMAAKREKEAAQRTAQRKASTGFGSGLKRGFLSAKPAPRSAAASAPSASRRAPQAASSPVRAAALDKADDLPTVRARTGPSAGPASLALPEVQEAMHSREGVLSMLEGGCKACPAPAQACAH